MTTNTTTQVATWRKACNDGTLADDLNPLFTFGMTATDILVQIASGKINAAELAQMQLANRGLNQDGKWVGFTKAAAELGIK